MRKLISLHLALVFILSTISPAFAQTKKAPAKKQAVAVASTCENGECIEGLVNKLEKLSVLYRKQCLPKNIKDSEIAAYHEKNGFTEQCWKQITEISHLEKQLAQEQNRLEARQGCASGDCKLTSSPGDDLTSQINSLSKVDTENSCTPQKKAAVIKQCPADMNCALMAGATGIGGYAAELVVPSNWKPAGCHLGEDNCTTQLVTGFLKSAMTFFNAAWDILKFVKKKAGQGLNKFWNWVTDAEDHASTSQLALAKASEDPGVFDMLMKDFPGTMKKVWQALVASLKEWMKADILCQKWSGAPHFSTCLKPTDSIDCLPCKTMVNGLCAVSGAVLAEVVPAFFTGGLTTAAKYGASGAVKIAKLFKVSASTIKAMKATKLAKTALLVSTKVDDVLRVTKGLKVAKAGVQVALGAIKTYMLSPTRHLLKTSLGALTSLAKKGTAYIAETTAGKVLVFSGKALKTTGKVIIYPIDNPLTAAAFKSGQRTFDKLFTLGSPKLLVSTSSVAGQMIRREPAVEAMLAKLESARIAQKPQTAKVAKLELEVYNQMTPMRREVLAEVLEDTDDLDEVIKLLYPELQYSSLAKTVGADKVLAAEKELWTEISKLSDGAVKDALTAKYYKRINENALRAKIIKAVPTKEQRLEDALYTLRIHPESTEQGKKWAQALEDAANLGPDANKHQILIDGGWSPAAADEVVKQGMVGKAKARVLTAEEIKTNRLHETLTQLRFRPQTQDEAAKMADALDDAFKLGPDDDKYKVLTEGGFSPNMADEIIEQGLVGPAKKHIRVLTPEEIKTERLHDALTQLRYLPKNQEHAAKLADALDDAIKLGPDADKYKVLTQGGFDPAIADEVIRQGIVGPSPKHLKIIENAHLPKDKRFEEALLAIRRTPASEEEAVKLSKALDDAHLHGDGTVYEYSWRELREKNRILIDGGFTPAEADEILRIGLAGRPPVRELIEPGKTLFSGFAEDILDADYLTRRDEFLKLLREQDPKKKKILDTLLNKAKPSETISDNVESLYFIDYRHSASDLELIMDGGKKISQTPLSEKYQKIAFKNFKETRNWLLKEKPDLNKETLLDIHKGMIKDGVADFGTPNDLGKIRDVPLIGNVPEGYALSPEILKEINGNPYLKWVEAGVTGEGKHYGRIHYPNINSIGPDALKLAKKQNPELVLKIEELQGIPKKIEFKEAMIANTKAGSPKIAKLQEEIQVLRDRKTELTAIQKNMNQELVDALVDDLMDWFTRQRTAIGEINSPEKLDEYVSLLADFQKRLVSIHPLMDGNGRSTREFISYALMKEGFPPPRIIDPNADLYTSLDDWKKMIKHGILASDFLMDDMIERLKFGLPIDNSTDLITPYSRPPVKMTLKGEKKVPYMDGVEYIDPRLYREIVKRLIKTDPALKLELVEDPLKAWDKIHKKADEVFANNNIYFKHPKKGIGRVEIGYVDDDFKILYGKSSFDDQALFDFKMKSWYSDDINWRGLASKHATKSEAEIVDMFKDLNSHMASNAVLKKIRGGATPETIKKAALEDFDKMNEDIFGDGLVNMARDHSETGPMYGISYGYSTSKNREVGKAFAMGAMVVGKYGEHKLPELQALLKSRVLVGARKSMKDVDLGRLKQVRPEFSYKYGRQQEVMGIGASDPDAITIIQTIDAEGEVMLTYLRNPKKADEIWVIKGDIEPNATPTPEQLERTINLTR